MSAEATGWVYRHSPFKGATFAVHHAIADSVNDIHGHLFWMARPNLARKARVGPAKVSEAVALLAAEGFIEPVDEGMDDPAERQRAGRPARWRFLFPDVEVVYDTRKVSPEATGTRRPRREGGVAKDDRGVSPTATGVSPEARRNPRTTQPSSQPAEPASGGSPRGERQRFVEFDALVAVFGEPGTKEEGAFYAKVARSLKQQGKTADEIRDRGQRARSRHATCTPNVLLTRWSQFAPPGGGAAPRGRFDDLAGPPEGS